MKTILTSKQILEFQNSIYNFYKKNQRQFIWRDDITAYKILISEVMLQQTQTSRVIAKFEQWLKIFPDFTTLAQASNLDILTAWQGLGYNRRGLALGTIAQKVIRDHQGILPCDVQILQTFPAIGPNTAGSICAFAFNHPTIFIETNIRTVFTYHFFKEQNNVSDKQLLPYIQATLDHNNAREWYYALMDYGVFLKKQLPAINAKSKHYAKQSQFLGSKRQVRGLLIKILTQVSIIDIQTMIEMVEFELPTNQHNIEKIIQLLVDEKIIRQEGQLLSL